MYLHTCNSYFTSYMYLLNCRKYMCYIVSNFYIHVCLRSDNQNLLKIPKSRMKFYGDRAFSVAGSTLWNKLPCDLRTCTSLDVFKTKLKTLFFKEAYGCN